MSQMLNVKDSKSFGVGNGHSSLSWLTRFRGTASATGTSVWVSRCKFQDGVHLVVATQLDAYATGML